MRAGLPRRGDAPLAAAAAAPARPSALAAAGARRLRWQGVPLELRIPAGVFAPSPCTATIAAHLRVRRGESLLDVGTGSGVLAILGARLGAEAWATDVSAAALAAAAGNARRNGVRVRLVRTRLLAGLGGSFDVIVTNPPQTLLPPGLASRLPAHRRLALDGGPGGNSVLLALLEQALRHMHGGSRLYASVDTETCYRDSLRWIAARFHARLLAHAVHPLEGLLAEHLHWYLEPARRGMLSLFRRDGRWMTHQYLFELRPRAAAGRT